MSNLCLINPNFLTDLISVKLILISDLSDIISRWLFLIFRFPHFADAFCRHLLQSSTTTHPQAGIACALNLMCLRMATLHPEPPPQQQQRSCGSAVPSNTSQARSLQLKDDVQLWWPCGERSTSSLNLALLVRAKLHGTGEFCLFCVILSYFISN